MPTVALSVVLSQCVDALESRKAKQKPWGRCGCDVTKPCVAASDHVLMRRFTDRLVNNRFDPIALFGGKRSVRLKCCADYMEINIGLIE